MTSVKDLRKRVEAASQYRRRWDPLMRDLYDYVIPYRNDFSSATPGDQLTEKIFDGTATESAFRFAGRMQQDLVPPGQKFFKLFAGPAIKLGEMEKKSFDEQLQLTADTVLAALDASSFHMNAHGMFLDLFGGTGAMLILEGDDTDPVRFLAPAVREVLLEAGPYGDIWGRHWVKSFPAAQLKQMWPRGVFSDATKNKIESEGDALIGICQSSTWDPSEKVWRLTVFEHAAPDSKGGGVATSASDDAPPIFTEVTKTSPWITPRFMVVPGEPYGRGPGLIALPFVKTLNKAVELDLKAATLALYGVWASRDDDFNVDTARFEAGAIWSVSSTGGPTGPSLMKLDVPGKYDLSRVVTEEQRLQIRRATFDDALPPDSAAVRSATEIMERMKQLSQDYGGVFGRLTLEIVQPLVLRVMEILHNKRVLPTQIKIDALNVGLKVVSPIADTQGVAQARRIVDYAQMIAMLEGPQAIRRYLRDGAMIDLGRGIGVPERNLTDAEEREAFDKRMAQAAAADNDAALSREIVKGAVAGGIRPAMSGDGM